MPHVSISKLKPEIHDRLLDVLIEVITSTNKTKSGLLFTHHFLSPTEQTMLAKRLGIALLLKRGYTYDLIMEYLKVSKGTVAKVAEIISTNDSESQKILDKIIHNKEIEETLAKFEYHIRKLIPPKGRNWTVWRSNLEKNNRISEEPL